MPTLWANQHQLSHHLMDHGFHQRWSPGPHQNARCLVPVLREWASQRRPCWQCSPLPGPIWQRQPFRDDPGGNVGAGRFMDHGVEPHRYTFCIPTCMSQPKSGSTPLMVKAQVSCICYNQQSSETPNREWIANMTNRLKRTLVKFHLDFVADPPRKLWIRSGYLW